MITKNMIINYLVDCEGYSEDDAKEMIKDGSWEEYSQSIKEYNE
jgi:hypothetical protein